MRRFTVRMLSNTYQWSIIAHGREGYGSGVDRWRSGSTGQTPLSAVVSDRRGQVPQPNEVVRGDGEGEHPRHALATAMTELPQAADRLQPTEDLFYALPLLLTDLVPRMTRGPLVDRTASMRVVLGDMRRDVQTAHVLDKTGRVVVLIPAQGHAALTGNLRRHRERGVALGRPRRQIHHDVDGQPVAVFH